jgi:hydroxymethylpyrimidine/phosphomethylpyrimidine kinase
VRSVHEAPPEFVRDELDVVFEDIGVDAAKTGMLFSRRSSRRWRASSATAACRSSWIP